MTNYTFSSLGFSDVANFAKVTMDEDGKTFLPIEVSKKDEPIYKFFLIPTVMKYLQHAGEEIGFVAAIAYFMDGHVEYAYNKSNSRSFAVTGGSYADCSPEFIKSEIMEKCPSGLMLYQEIPGNGESYLFRVIHDSPSDSIDKIPKLDTRKIRKLGLIESTMEYLETYHGQETFKEEEIAEIIAIMDLIAALDPDGKYISRNDERGTGMGTFPLGRKNSEKPGKIVEFPTR